MNVEIGTEAAQFPEEEYKNENFLADCTKYTTHTGNRHSDHIQGTDVWTTHKKCRYTDHKQGTDVYTTHREQICRPQSEN
jgi:hypothetical protein